VGKGKVYFIFFSSPWGKLLVTVFVFYRPPFFLHPTLLPGVVQDMGEGGIHVDDFLKY
jgi:hypothetical protein